MAKLIPENAWYSPLPQGRRETALALSRISFQQPLKQKQALAGLRLISPGRARDVVKTLARVNGPTRRP
jgi:hypothetical protein